MEGTDLANMVAKSGKPCIVEKAEFMVSSGPAIKAVNMNEIQKIDIDKVEAHMLTLPPVDCPVEHIFGPGIYIRQVFLPAGAIVMGHAHKHESLNMVLTGRIALLEDGVRREVAAPYVFTGSVGRKLCYVLEDCVFQNIFATKETDIGRLEEMFVEKSDTFMEAIL